MSNVIATGPGRLFSLLAAFTLLATLSACGTTGSAGGGGGADAERPESENVAATEPPQDTTSDPRERREATRSADPAIEEAGVDAGANGAGGVRDGVWKVGDAGSVEFLLQDGALTLVETRTNPGWSAEIDEEEPQRIDVDFRRANVEWEFEVGTSRNMEIGIKQRIEPAEAGTYQLGDAGEVKLGVEGGSLVLAEVQTNERWSSEIDKQESDRIELDLERANERWRFRAELDDGELGLELDRRIKGALAN